MPRPNYCVGINTRRYRQTWRMGWARVMTSENDVAHGQLPEPSKVSKAPSTHPRLYKIWKEFDDQLTKGLVWSLIVVVSLLLGIGIHWLTPSLSILAPVNDYCDKANTFFCTVWTWGRHVAPPRPAFISTPSYLTPASPDSAPPTDGTGPEGPGVFGCIQSTSAKPPGLYCPGWVVSVSNAKSQGPAGFFVASNYGHFSITEHKAFFDFTVFNLIYDGVGILKVGKTGPYYFTVNGNSGDDRCDYKLLMEGRTLIDISGRTSMTAKVDLLMNTSILIKFRFSCIKSPSSSNPPKVPTMDLRVLSPEDSVPRPLRPDELYHLQGIAGNN